MLLSYTITATVCEHLFDMTDVEIDPIATSISLTTLVIGMIYYFIYKNRN